jgi:N-acetylglucosamine kinase-like BadF-type ATPase
MYLGVDGGGTKTALAVVDIDGKVLAKHQAGAAYYLSSGLDEVRDMLKTAVQAVLARANLRAEQLEFAFFGLPSYGEDSTLLAVLDRLPAVYLPAGRYRCGNDMVCGWAGSLGGGDGISVVAGTGSISYGERGGVSARCGGWGEIFSDEGSAYWIACRALNLYSRMSDGRAPRGPLHARINEHFGLAHDLDLCARVYGKAGADRARLAQLSRLVYEVASGGDPQAAGLFTEAAGELANLVDAIRRQLEFGADEPVPVSYSGGVFANAGTLLLPRFAAALRARRSRYELREPSFPPDIGAALYAARCRGRPLSAAALQRLREAERE